MGKARDKGSWTKRNLFLIVVILFSCFLMFTNLGNRYLGGDQTQTTLTTQSITKYGYPYSFHDGQLVYASYVQDLMSNTSEPTLRQVSDNYVWREQPWLYYYVLAPFFTVFGTSNFVAKFPFALIGIATLVLFYFFSKKVTKNMKNGKIITNISLILLSFSTIFYLYARQSRYFSILMFGTIGLLWAYINLLENKSKIPFIIFGLILAHTNYAILAGIMVGLLAHFFIYKYHKKKLKEMLISLGLMFIFFAPWYFAMGMLSHNTSEIALSGKYFFYVFTGFINLFLIIGLPLVFIPLFSKLFNKKHKQNIFVLISLVIISSILVLSIHNEAPPVRYLITFLPLVCLINGAIISYIFGKNKIIAGMLVLLLVTSNLLFVFPLNFIKQPLTDVSGDIEISFIGKGYQPMNIPSFVGSVLTVRSFLSNYIYEITHDYDGAPEIIVNYLNENGMEGDTFIANNEGIVRTIMWYTNMKYVNQINNDAPSDWIIFYYYDDSTITEHGKNLQAEFFVFIDSKVNLNKYEKIKIDWIGNKRSAETSNPLYHNYKTDLREDDGGSISLYKLKK